MATAIAFFTNQPTPTPTPTSGQNNATIALTSLLPSDHKEGSAIITAIITQVVKVL
jgi:hypothetical protein